MSLLMLSTVVESKAQAFGYAGHKFAIKAGAESYHFAPMYGLQVEYLAAPRFGIAVSANRRSFEDYISVETFNNYENGIDGPTQFGVTNVNLLLRFYDDESTIIGSQIGKYKVIQLGLNRLSAVVPLAASYFDRDGIRRVNAAPEEKFSSNGYVAGYGKGVQKVFAKRFLLDFSTTAYISYDRAFDYVLGNPQSEGLAVSTRDGIFSSNPFYLGESGLGEGRVSANLRVALKLGFLL